MGLKVLFVYPLPSPGPAIYPGFHHGIASLAAVLRNRGHFPLLYATHSCDRDGVRKVLDQGQPDLVGLTSTTAEFPLAQALVREIMNWGRIPIFLGGIHATVAPEEVAALEGVTGLCRGEGELGFLRVVQGLEQGGLDREVPGFWFREGGQWRRNAPGPPTCLEDLPFPDRELFDYARWVRPVKKIMGAEFMGSRGCPFHCSYCCTPLLSDLYRPHAYWRRRTVEDLIAEIKVVMDRYPTEMVGFHDDIFTLDKEWLESFCSRYPREIGRPFWCNTRVGCVTEEQARMLRRAGCVRVHVAIESGNQRLREEVLNRRVSDEEIMDTFAFLKKAGLKRMAFNMLGLPFETEDTIRETIALNRVIRPDRVHVTTFQPYPGTAIYRLCQEEGLLKTGEVGSYYDETTLVSNPRLPPEVLFRYLRQFVSMVYGQSTERA